MAERVTPVEMRLMAAVAGSLEGVNVTALCAEARVSRKTFYKWRGRFVAEGLAGLEVRSRRPQRRTRVAKPANELSLVIGIFWNQVSA